MTLSFESSESNENKWEELTPSKPDRNQGIIFGLHVIIAVVFSYHQFIISPTTWFSGAGLITPIFFGFTGLAFGVVPGINWYREEFIPYMNRQLTFPEFQTEEFLRLKRLQLLAMLIAGYISTMVCQVTWASLVRFLLPFIEVVHALGELLFYAIAGLFVIYLVLLFGLILLFDHLLVRRFQGIKALIEFESEWTKAMNELKKKSEGLQITDDDEDVTQLDFSED